MLTVGEQDSFAEDPFFQSFSGAGVDGPRQLALTVPPSEKMPIVEPLTLVSLAQVVDRSLVSGAEFPDVVLQDARELVTRQMQATRVAAGTGLFTGKSVSECDVAVAVEFLTGDEDLWPAIVEFLCDPQVQRDDKTGALNRMVRSPENVPPFARVALRERVQQLLSGGPTFIGPAVDPYPSALGVCALLDLLPNARVLSLIASLSGSHVAQVRTEGVQIISAMVSHGLPQPWLATSALLLSFDDDIAVRASAGYTLCMLRDFSEVSSETVESRIVALLGSSGRDISLAVLAGLQQAAHAPNPRVRKVLTAMAATHLSRTVRLIAGNVLEREE